MSKFTITQDIERYYVDIENVLKRLDYPIVKEDCSHVVLKNCTFVGAYNITDAGVPKNCVRINWLAVTKTSERKNMHVGSFILKANIDEATAKKKEAIYLSVRESNLRANRLYNKFDFKIIDSQGKEKDLKLNLSKIG